MNLVRLAALGALLFVLGVGSVACGDDGNDGDATPPASTAPAGETPSGAPTEPAAETPSGPQTPPAGAGKVIITAADFSFTPSTIEVSAASDTTIQVNNAGSTIHTLNVYEDRGFTQAIPAAESGEINPGEAEEFTLLSVDLAGKTSLFFRCEIHPSQMQGTITVQ